MLCSDEVRRHRPRPASLPIPSKCMCVDASFGQVSGNRLFSAATGLTRAMYIRVQGSHCLIVEVSSGLRSGNKRNKISCSAPFVVKIVWRWASGQSDLCAAICPQTWQSHPRGGRKTRWQSHLGGGGKPRNKDQEGLASPMFGRVRGQVGPELEAYVNLRPTFPKRRAISVTESRPPEGTLEQPSNRCCVSHIPTRSLAGTSSNRGKATVEQRSVACIFPP